MGRVLFLLLGPAALVGGLYELTLNEGDSLRALPEVRKQWQRVADRWDESQPVSLHEDGQRLLIEKCEWTAAELRTRLGDGVTVIQRAPYVLAGDLAEDDLERCYQNVIRPVERALSTCYFDARPDQPIVLVLMSNEQSYHAAAQALDGRLPRHYSGYYLRGERRIVANVATGTGTLAHELTHALAHFDFPAMPEWFDEGLASLHEQSEFSDDGLRIGGTSNWRLNHLREALHRDTLAPLDALLTADGIRPGHEAVDYAHARYFCLWLQQRQLLEAYYRKFRLRADDDPTGRLTLCDLLGVEDLEPVDRAFRAWVAAMR